MNGPFSILRLTPPRRSTVIILIIILIFDIIYFIVKNQIAPQRDYVRMPFLLFFGTCVLMMFVVLRNIRYQFNKKSNPPSFFALIVCIAISSLSVREAFSQSPLGYLFWLAVYECDIIPVCEWNNDCRFISQIMLDRADGRCNEQYCPVFFDSSYVDENNIVVSRLLNYNPNHNLEYFVDIKRPNVEYITNFGPLVVYKSPG